MDAVPDISTCSRKSYHKDYPDVKNQKDGEKYCKMYSSIYIPRAQFQDYKSEAYALDFLQNLEDLFYVYTRKSGLIKMEANKALKIYI